MNESTPQQNSEIVYSLSRLEWLGGWWGWALSIVVLGLLVFMMVRLYRRDANELTGATRWTLILLRCGVIIGLVFFFFSFGQMVYFRHFKKC